MLRRLFGYGSRRGSGRRDPWEALVAASPAASDEADRFIGEAARKVAPELGRSTSVVVLGVQEAESAFGTFLREIEAALEELCDRYDYRQLLFVSRLCAELPWFRPGEEPRYALMRTRNADRWVLSSAGGI